MFCLLPTCAEPASSSSESEDERLDFHLLGYSGDVQLPESRFTSKDLCVPGMAPEFHTSPVLPVAGFQLPVESTDEDIEPDVQFTSEVLVAYQRMCQLASKFPRFVKRLLADSLSSVANRPILTHCRSLCAGLLGFTEWQVRKAIKQKKNPVSPKWRRRPPVVTWKLEA